MKSHHSRYVMKKTNCHFDRSDASHREAEKSVHKQISRLAFRSLEMTFGALFCRANSKFKTCPDLSRGIQNSKRKGAALLVVLFIVMAITVLAVGFLSRSDVELACGQNMMLRTQMDYLAESGLQHAKGLILNPQDVDSEYWLGAEDQQLVAGSEDYYDVEVVRDDSDRCNYIIDCDSYRLKGGEQVGRSSLTAELRLDPCIALWTGTDTTTWNGFSVYGDVYCKGTLINKGSIHGDVFATGTIDGLEPDGRKNQSVTSAPLYWPFKDEPPTDVVDWFKSNYTWDPITSGTLTSDLGPFDPAHVFYRNGDLTLTGDVTITGMLLVDGDLRISGSDNVITAGKNLPALYVATGDLIIGRDAILDVGGLVVVDKRVLINGGARLNVLGGFFIKDGIVETTADSSDNGNTGILYNGPAWQSIDGRNALEFDGVDDYVRTHDDPGKLQLPADCNYTLSVWIKPDSTQEQWAGIFSKTDPGGTINHWTLQFDSSNPRKLIIYHPTGWWNTGINLGHVADAWHHIAVVRRGDTMTAYLDGIARASGTLASPASGNGHLNIGADRTALPSYVYGGLIDDARVYNRALDPGEVLALPNDSSLIAHWKFDEANADVTITAAPTKTAILVGPQSNQQRWGQAAGAFFRSIERK